MGISWRLVILSIFSCALATQTLQRDSHTHADKKAVDPGWSELKSSVDDMHRAMASVEPSGNSDVDFVRLVGDDLLSEPAHLRIFAEEQLGLRHGDCRMMMRELFR